MKIFLSGLVAALAVSFVVQTAAAQRPGRPGPQGGPPALFKALDVDGDRELSTDEIQKATEALKGLDKNKDGKLTRNELIGSGPRPDGFRGGPRDSQRGPRGPQREQRGPKGPRGPEASRGHRGPGRPQASRGSRGPHRGAGDRGPQSRGRRGDRPAASGRPSSRGSRGPQHGPKSDRGGQSRSRRPDGARGGRPGGSDRAGALMSRLLQSDKNGDGKISKEEAPERMKRAFDHIDANSDGVIDKGELKKMTQRIQAGGRNRGGPSRSGRRPEGRPERKPDSKQE